MVGGFSPLTAIALVQLLEIFEKENTSYGTYGCNWLMLNANQQLVSLIGVCVHIYMYVCISSISVFICYVFSVSSRMEVLDILFF